MTLLAYHNDPKIKAKYLRRVRAHMRADQLVQDYGYWEDGKGCAVSCTIHSSDHAAYETELGIPKSLALLEETLFEGMGKAAARVWPERFLKAIPVGADLSLVPARLIVWILDDLAEKQSEFAEVAAACSEVAGLYRRRVASDEPESSAWSAAESAAWSAVVESSAWSAAWSAADSAWYATQSAAESAVLRAAAESAAESAAYERFADQLITLMEQA